MKCSRCKKTAQVALPSHHAGFCPECFFLYFSRQVARAIKDQRMIAPGERVLVALSGGKDSLSLATELKLQGIDVSGLHVDLAIPGVSEGVRGYVETFCNGLGIPLIVKDMALEGLPIPEVKKTVKRPICSVCGKIKRHYFNRVALEGGFTALATGHNLDDEVSRLFANTLRWDTAYLAGQGPCLPAETGFAKKIRPLYRLTEFETACYAFLRGIDHWSAPCPYSDGATFTVYKRHFAKLEEDMPGSKIRFYDSFLDQGRPAFEALDSAQVTLVPCHDCSMPTPESTGGECGVCRIRRYVRQGREDAEASAGPFGSDAE